MSVQSEITRIDNNVKSTLSTIASTGVEVPTGANSDSLPSLVSELANTKQNVLNGTSGQVVGFNAEGVAIAQSPETLGIAKAPAEFDLTAMGLGAATPGGDAITLTTDTTAIRTAMAAGDVRFDFQFLYSGVTMGATVVVSPMYLELTNEYQAVFVGELQGVPMAASFTVTTSAITARCSVLADKSDVDELRCVYTADSTDGVTYTLTIPWINALAAGQMFSILPTMTSTSVNTKLNVNSLGDKYLRRPLTTNNSATTTGYSDGWIIKNKPVLVMYDGTYFKTVTILAPDANTIYGTVKVENGGTGGVTAEAALENLGAMAAAVYDPQGKKQDVFAYIDETILGGEW